jgi:hypothetical protein
MGGALVVASIVAAVSVITVAAVMWLSRGSDASGGCLRCLKRKSGGAPKPADGGESACRVAQRSDAVCCPRCLQLQPLQMVVGWSHRLHSLRCARATPGTHTARSPQHHKYNC